MEHNLVFKIYLVLKQLFKGIFSFQDYLHRLKIVGNALPSGLNEQMYFYLKYVCSCAYFISLSLTKAI